jgi:hypothetical protein
MQGMVLERGGGEILQVPNKQIENIENKSTK